ncbi:MAG: hypothetical protein V4599_10065 [Verrucomicrobiota bacterium]
MKAIFTLLLVGALLPSLSSAATAPRSQAPGLLIQEYPRHAAQANDQTQFHLAPEDFGPPIGQPEIAKSLYPWKWNTERNAIASGFLEIAQDGDYAFSSRSFYDRNLLLINDRIVCSFRDGDSAVTTLPLKKGRVKFTSVGMVESRGGNEGIHIQWKPPGQAEMSPIPPDLLSHTETEASRIAATPPARLRAAELITATNDYIVEAYRNGVKIHDSKRKLLHEHFGATVERIAVDIRPGDWLVFQVVHNRLRWEGSRYFAVAGMLAPDRYGFVSDPASPEWSVCDDPAQAQAFIRQRDSGTSQRASSIAKPWKEGDGFMQKFAGPNFPGKALWGGSSSTWIKYVAAESTPPPVTMAALTFNQGPCRLMEVVLEDIQSQPRLTKPVSTPPADPTAAPTRWPVQILSAIYGTGGKDADVTAAVKEHVEVKRRLFAVTPPDLGNDPNPYWNKALHIVYMKDGVRREQHRGENEHVLPHSFYGPQDMAELRTWMLATRWKGEKGEIQFHASGTLTGPGLEGAPTWETLANNKFRITWSAEQKTEYVFDYTGSSFHQPDNAAEAFHVVK